MDVETVESGHTTDHSYLKKDYCDRKAAGHPLPVLLNLSPKNENQRNPGSNHPQGSVHGCGNAKRSGIPEPFFKMLNVNAEWRRHEHTSEIDSADYPM